MAIRRMLTRNPIGGFRRRLEEQRPDPLARALRDVLRAFGSLEPILVAVSRLGADAYGLTIRGDVSARTGHDYSVGASYTTLHRLEEKGVVTSRVAEPLPVRGGRARREFKLTAVRRCRLHADGGLHLGVARQPSVDGTLR
jgi:PadR family transcriptional regulator PadR